MIGLSLLSGTEAKVWKWYQVRLPCDISYLMDLNANTLIGSSAKLCWTLRHGDGLSYFSLFPVPAGGRPFPINLHIEIAAHFFYYHSISDFGGLIV